MKKAVFGLMLFLLAFSFAPTTMAATFDGGEMYSLGSGTEVDDDLYVGAANVTVSGDALADLVAFGSNVLINGSVGHDLLTAGGSVSVLNDVADDLRVAGGTVMVDSVVGDELMAAGGMLQILSGTTVAGDMVLAGGYIVFDGLVEGETMIYGDEVVINGTLQGDVMIEAGTKLTIGSGAVIDGDVLYKGSTEAVIDEGAFVNGEFVYERVSRAQYHADGFGVALAAFVGVMNLVKLLVLLVSAVVLVLVFKKYSKEVVRLGLTKPGRGFLTGFVCAIVIPVAVVILMFTVVGIGFGILGMLAYAFFILLSKVYGGMLLGGLFAKWAKSKVGIDWKWALLGVLVLQIVCLVPIIGWALYCIFFLIAFGSLLQVCYKKLWLTR